MKQLIAEEGDGDEEDNADKDFYTQDFWAEDEEDVDFADADDEAAHDSFDSDFGDSTESDSDNDDEEKGASKEKTTKKKSVYKDPKAKAAREEGSSSAAPSAPKPKVSHKKRPRSEAAALADGTPFAPRGSMRASTKDASLVANEKRKLEDEVAQRRRMDQEKRRASKPGVELRRLTQEEILEEAKHTEVINRASLERMLRQEEEKRKVVVRDRSNLGPRIKYVSKREGDSVVNTITFVECNVPSSIDDIAPPYPVPQRCAVTGLAAKYYDPGTGSPYANLEAFRMLRGRTGRRSSYSNLQSAAAEAEAAPADLS
uniref:Vps72/YL1 C-terminal domain-containing protein n=1 Tax=Haptolina ericina TaxID=156174 RepID=A0A7S3AQ94_9EUKA